MQAILSHRITRWRSVSSHWPVVKSLFLAYDELALAAFGRVAGEAKADGSTVTVLDRQASQLVVDRLARETPEYGIVSEEEEQAQRMDAEWKWVVDPLDGTASFARGYPIWGLGIGLLRDAQPVEGYLRFSALGETLAAHDGVLLWNGQALVRRRDPPIADTHNALIGSSLHGEVPYQKLTGFKLRNYGSNLYHLASLALGRADVVLSPRCYLWDLAAALPFTRAMGMIEVYTNGQPFDLGDLLHPKAHFRTRGPMLVGPPHEVQRVLAQLA